MTAKPAAAGTTSGGKKPAAQQKQQQQQQQQEQQQPAAGAEGGTGAAAPASWASLGLDARLVRGLLKRGLAVPTPVQASVVPAALAGKDVVARARTGTGKTLAYLLPAAARCLAGGGGANGGANGGAQSSSWQVLVLAPTRELCEQIAAEARLLASASGLPPSALSATALVADSPAAQRAAAQQAGAVVVTTPGRCAAALRAGWLAAAPSVGSSAPSSSRHNNPPSSSSSASSAVVADLSRLRLLVLDEADLLLAYGGGGDLAALAPALPRGCQALLLSATSGKEVEDLTRLVLHNPVSLNLLSLGGGGGVGGGGGREREASAALGAGGSGAAATIRHFCVRLPRGPSDRMLAVLALLRLPGLVKRKALVFVNSVDAGVRLRLFLEAFGLRPGLLNSALPLNSRSHTLAAFHRGLFDVLIATDDVEGERAVVAGAAVEEDQEEEEEEEEESGSDEHESGSGSEEEEASEGDDEEESGSDEDEEEEEEADGRAQKKRKPQEAAAAQRAGKQRQKKGKAPPKQQQKARGRDAEFGVTRGIDFKGVCTVINAEPPATVGGYVHRVGRTGRAGERGEAITLLASGPGGDAAFEAALRAVLARDHVRARGGGAGALGQKGEEEEEEEEEEVQVVEEGQQPPAQQSKPAAAPAAAAAPPASGRDPLPELKRLPASALDALRYRGEDVARSLTRRVVRETRAAELRRELLNSARLKEYFFSSGGGEGGGSGGGAAGRGAAEAAALRAERAVLPRAGGGGAVGGGAAPHLKNLPAYLRASAGVRSQKEARKEKAKAKKAAAVRGGVGGRGGASSSAAHSHGPRDPLKALPAAGAVFGKPGRKRKGHGEELTEAEKRSEEKARAAAKKEARKAGGAVAAAAFARKGGPIGPLPKVPAASALGGGGMKRRR